MGSSILANVIRGETVESVHRGHLIAINGEGEMVIDIGAPDTVTFFRSACKAFQALPFITSGACDAFGYSEEEVALACASHSGEARHVRVAQPGQLDIIVGNELLFVGPILLRQAVYRISLFHGVDNTVDRRNEQGHPDVHCVTAQVV